MKRTQWDAWIAALESGEWGQVRGWLGTPEGHCCVGILCEITPGVARRGSHEINGTNAFVYAYGEDDGGTIQVLPEPLAIELGFDDGNIPLTFDRVPPEVEGRDHSLREDGDGQPWEARFPYRTTATYLNDGCALPFNQIAAVIRQSREYQRSE